MNSRIPSPARPLFRNPPSVHSKLQFTMDLPPPLLPTPTQLQSSPQWPATSPTPLISNKTLKTFVLLLDKLQELTRINQYTLDLLRLGDIKVILRSVLDLEVARIYPADNKIA